MSKAYKGKTCAYCAEPEGSTTGDHVFAREFFPETRRANLPKVPACEPCNRTKSELEHYLTAVLPFAGRHDDASEVLNSMVPGRLAKNHKLHRELAASQSHAWVKRAGMIAPAMTLHLDASQLEGLVRYIVRGLVRYHWNVVVPADYAVGVGIWTDEGERLITSAMPFNGKAVAQESWGAGAFEYRGVQATDDPFLSVWRLSMYGGAVLGGDAEQGHEVSPRIWAMTSREPAEELFRY